MKNSYIILLLQLVLVCSGAFSQSLNQNYIKTTTYINDGNTPSESIRYYDGLGRPVQTVQKGITPQRGDLASYIEYDAFGREWKSHLPVIGSGNGAFVPLSGFSSSTLYGGDSRPFSETLYEPSPLNRVTAQKGPGSAWNTHPVTIDYQSNSYNEVKLFTVNSAGQLINSGRYATGTLYKTVTKDEDNKTVIEYKDREGRVVMIRGISKVEYRNKYGRIMVTYENEPHDTYYVYDSRGLLAYVLPPLAADGNGSEDAINKYGYVYKYDEQGNCIYKKLPGCAYIRMAYDKAGRMIVSQDGNLRSRNESLVTRYDAFGRVIYTHTIFGYPMEPYLSRLKKKVFIDEYNGTGDFGYTVNSHGIGVLAGIRNLLTVNYYDNYDFLTDDSLKYVGKAGYCKAYTDKTGTANPAHADLNVKGLLSGTRIYQLQYEGVTAHNKYTTEAYYYDDKGNMVQKRSTNHLGGYDIEYNDLDFNGKPNKTLKTHTSPGSAPNYEFGYWKAVSLSELYSYFYDHAGRLVKTTYSVNNRPAVILSDLTNGGYDELGRIKTKKRHNGTDTESFEYTIRSQPKKITSGGFTEELYYNEGLPNGSTPCFNGNIAYSTWTFGNIKAGYKYKYDGLNRLTDCNFIDVSKNSYLEDEYYNEHFRYDKMGNVSYLSRTISGKNIDALSFTYNGNLVRQIYDDEGSRNQYGIKEYQDKSDEQIEFYYDANGNLTADLDRDIVTIKYNLLNLPEVIQFKNGNQIWNYYDASGRKLKTLNTLYESEIVVPIGSVQGAHDSNPCNNYYFGTEYVGNIEYSYEDDCDYLTKHLSKVYHPEGYVSNIKSSTGIPVYNYYRRDHLGSIREVWAGNTQKTIQRTWYYPSGLPIEKGYNPDYQQRKYNGKEWIEAHGLDEYDSQARMYYPAIMRTTTIDPLCEKYYSISPYAWCGNNPVRFIDPDGRDARLVGTGAKEDPYIIQAKYFYKNGSLNEDQLKGLSGAIAAYNSAGGKDGIKIKNEDGGFSYVKFDLSAEGVDDVNEARLGTAFENTSGDTQYYGNIVGTEVNTGNEFGSANNYRIDFNVENINAGVDKGMNSISLNKGVAIHEIGHNLGAEHSDGTSVMDMITTTTVHNQIGGTTVIHNYPSMDKRIAKILINRRDVPRVSGAGRIWTQKH